MGYKYEKNVVAEIKELGAKYKAPSFYAMAQEVSDVYAKAKAFEEIVNLLKTSHSDYAEDILEDIGVIVMDYWEGK